MVTKWILMIKSTRRETKKVTGKIENNKHPGAKEEQRRVRNKLKENLQIMRHKTRLLQKSESERLPKLKENSKLIELKK